MRVKPDSGLSVIELTVAMALLSMLVAVAFGWLAASQNAFKVNYERSQANNAASLAIDRLDRLIRSGNIFYDPALESDPGNGIQPGMALRVYTQANSVQKCVQWRITGGELQERSWSPTWTTDGEVSDWWIVSDDIVNQTGTKPAFFLNEGAAFGGRLLQIDLRVDKSDGASNEVQRQVSVEGRNTIYGYDPSVCGNLPPY